MTDFQNNFLVRHYIHWKLFFNMQLFPIFEDAWWLQTSYYFHTTFLEDTRYETFCVSVFHFFMSLSDDCKLMPGYSKMSEWLVAKTKFNIMSLLAERKISFCAPALAKAVILYFIEGSGTILWRQEMYAIRATCRIACYGTERYFLSDWLRVFFLNGKHPQKTAIVFFILGWV